MRSLFERLGGFVRVRLIVSEFYERVLASDLVRHHFEGVDMRRLVDHQTKFVASVMDGPASFSDEHLRRVHATLGVTHREFDEVAVILRETLEDFDIAAPDVDRICAQVLGLRDCIVAPDAAAIDAAS